MKIKMLVSIASPDWSFAPGDITDIFEDAIADKFIGNGFAEPVNETEAEKSDANASEH